jgi:two-component system chemotaxis response regulator CheY
MDGFAFISALRREPANHGIPALMTSTEAGPQDLLAARRAGANGYLVKPVPREQLSVYVAAILGRPPA